ncbi:BrnA antitoxin family protein [Burkholderia vietnamiensis]|uniref:BrnA antitoxin family protein n=1 Tax=Burkholderia vietnamiensis TaxID=60552 RepID=UPI001CF2F920|nr:BrnA antitoxin family protein [Burkholderia vietnamiensis]MCA8013326.1 BrnA antitoxin family protein [Burkholderia vietnamiensis]MCA8266434.1 BrnA antitoxin family protein [Burkholderia vietnamiensis]
MSSKRKLHIPSPEEDAAIQRGIEADADTFVPSDEQFAQMKRRGGRPRLANPKVAVTLRYDVEVIEKFRQSGPGWQTRMNDALRDWLKLHHA